MRTSFLVGLFCLLAASPSEAARKWTDLTGYYIIEADLVGVNDDTVVLQKTNPKKELVSLPVKNLSKPDQTYLKSKEATDAVEGSGSKKQIWTMRSGLVVSARVVEYGRRDVTIQRRRGKIYVNDRLFSNLHQIQQKVLLKVVSHFEKTDLADVKDLEKWIVVLKAAPRTYTCDGVMLELENGDEYGVPFFLFSDNDLKILQPGWQQWLAAHEAKEQDEKAHAAKEKEALLLQEQAEAYQRDKEADRKLKMVELDLLAAASGVTNIWEVELFPGRGVAGYARVVVVSGRTSEDAAHAALKQFPNYSVGSIAKVNRN